MKTTALIDDYDWSQIDRVIVLSPHLDDAVLSCAGLLRSLATKVSCLVITLCCGNPISRTSTPETGPQQGRPRKGFVTPVRRRREDTAAMLALGVDYVHLGFLDAVDRRSPISGDHIHHHPRQRWFRPSVEDANHVEELLLIVRRLCSGMGRILVVSPLGIGHHIDHIITAQVALRLPQKIRPLFYEDFPYAISERLGEGSHDPEAAIRELGQEPSARLFVPVDATDKANLIHLYESQVPSLFAEGVNVLQAVQLRTHHKMPSEFYWRTRAIGASISSLGVDP